MKIEELNGLVNNLTLNFSLQKKREICPARQNVKRKLAQHFEVRKVIKLHSVRELVMSSSEEC